MTFPTALAAPLCEGEETRSARVREELTMGSETHVEEGMMLAAAPRPPRQSLPEGPSTVFWVAAEGEKRRLATRFGFRSGTGRTGGVDGGHESLNDGELVVEDLGEGSKAVGGARGVGDDGVGGVVLVEVDTCSMREDENQCCSCVSVRGAASREPAAPRPSARQREVDLPQTYMGASAEGAEMTTFLAPPVK